MISAIGLHPKKTGAVLTVAFLAVTCDVSAQPEFDVDVSEALRQTEAAIQEVLLTNGPNSTDLIEPLSTLGFLYQEAGDYGSAAAAFQDAQDIARVSYGLESVEEANLLWQRIRSEEARGNIDAAWALQMQLLEDLIAPNRFDPRVAPILLEISARRQSILDRYLAGEFPREITLGCYFVTKCSSGLRRILLATLASEIDFYRNLAEHLDRWAQGCTRPMSGIAIPDKREISRSERRVLSEDVTTHLWRLRDHTRCLRSQYETLASANPDSVQLAHLQSGIESAVEEIRDTLNAFDERMGSVRGLEETLLNGFCWEGYGRCGSIEAFLDAIVSEPAPSILSPRCRAGDVGCARSARNLAIRAF